MTILENEIKTGWKLLEVDAEMLRETGESHLKFIVESEGERGVIFPEPEAANDAAAKTAVAELVQSMVQARNAHTVYHISDAWATRIEGNPKDRKALIEYVESIGVSRAAEMGLVRRRECLVCQITTRSGKSALLQWFYDRDDNSRTVTMLDRVETANQSDGVLGRFSHFFE